jgi:hypothetical protein
MTGVTSGVTTGATTVVAHVLRLGSASVAAAHGLVRVYRTRLAGMRRAGGER